MQNKNFLPIIVLCLLVLGLGYYIVRDISSQKEEIVNKNADVLGNNDKTGDENTQIEIVGVDEGSVVSTKPSIPVPNLERPIKIPENTPIKIKEQTLAEISRIMGLLKQDSNLFNEWSDLGLVMKSIDDYVWARDAWEYAVFLRPKDSLVFTNLANLYGYYLKEPEKAEKNYLKSIENDPKLPYLYVRAAFFYLEVLNDNEKARNIIEKGLQNIPGDDELEEALSEIDRF